MISLNPSLAAALKVGITAFVAGAFYMQPYRPMVFVGKSMEPTYHNRTFTWTEPVAKEDLRRGQVVVINMDSGPIVKRLAYLPGDSIKQIRTGGQWMDLVNVHPLATSRIGDLDYRKFVVPPGMAYVLGDNQQVSYDSKFFGCISLDRIQRILVDQRPPTVVGADRLL